ncbi:P63C domain-containing protein [Henriciella litoralis]|uniref:P63C domain-containing protein n=1 Tax=Henriciella litoralis TaxID=568102 RepID=UPI0009FFEA04|nr:P63C domain-containing protein [Henriciella litoralis]
MPDKKNPKKVAAANARSSKLSAKRRSEIAKKAAENRWAKHLPEAILEGSIPLGDGQISCAIVGDGTRVITQATFLRSLGRSRSPKAGTGVLATADELPFFLSSSAFAPFIDSELMAATTPVFYRTMHGGKGVGYNAQLLPLTAEVYLRFRDFHLAETGSIPERYESMVKAADAIMRSLAKVGIIALVDEATGYQDVRAKDALAKIFQQYLTEERQKWTQTFPLDFYKEIFRLRGWEFKPWTTKKPQVVAHWTNDLVYDRLAPGLTDELRKRNPTVAPGRRASKHHQWFTKESGHPDLQKHIEGVTALMRASDSWDQFKAMLNRAYKKPGDTLELSLAIDD